MTFIFLKIKYPEIKIVLSFFVHTMKVNQIPNTKVSPAGLEQNEFEQNTDRIDILGEISL